MSCKLYVQLALIVDSNNKSHFLWVCLFLLKNSTPILVAGRLAFWNKNMRFTQDWSLLKEMLIHYRFLLTSLMYLSILHSDAMYYYFFLLSFHIYIYCRFQCSNRSSIWSHGDLCWWDIFWFWRYFCWPCWTTKTFHIC